MELKEFIDLVKIDREKLAEIMSKDRKFIDYKKTLDCLNYISYPILTLLDEEFLEYRAKLNDIIE